MRELVQTREETRELTVPEIMRLTHSVAPLPEFESEPYGDEELAWLLSVARRLQSCDAGALEAALNEYCWHFETAFEPDVNPNAERGKVAALLRAIFATSTRRPGAPAPRRPLWQYSARPGTTCESDQWSAPFDWASDGPRICARDGANGMPHYPAADECEYMLKEFGYRQDLEASMTAVLRRAAAPNRPQ